MFHQVHFIIKCHYSIKNYQLEGGETAARKGLAHEAWWLSFNPQHMPKEPGVGAYTHNPSVGEAETGGFPGLTGRTL